MKAFTLLNSLAPAELERALTQDTEGFMETLRTNLGDEALTNLFGPGANWTAAEILDFPTRTHHRVEHQLNRVKLVVPIY
jgi:hypothetical protein